jgi:hypothetical protein
MYRPSRALFSENVGVYRVAAMEMYIVPLVVVDFDFLLSVCTSGCRKQFSDRVCLSYEQGLSFFYKITLLS